MRRFLTVAAVCFGFVFAGATGGFQLRAQAQAGAAPQAAAPEAPADTAELREQYEQWRQDFKTWGRWGTGDNKGASNLITPEKVLSAARLVQSGRVVSLAAPVPQVAAADVNENGLFNRTTLRITDGGTADNYQVSFHGLTVSHMDTWCHFFENGQMYNGVPVEGNLNEEEGCKQGSVMNWKDGVTTRAVLYDIAQLKGVGVGRSGYADYACRPRSVGGDVGGPGGSGRCGVAVHRSLEAARRRRGVERRRGRVLRRHDPLDA